MRRFIVTAVLAFVILAMLAPPGFAQAPAPKVTISGLFDQVTAMGRNQYDGNFTRNSDREWYARTRFRPDLEFADGRVKAVLGLEIDLSYGQMGVNDHDVRAEHQDQSRLCHPRGSTRRRQSGTPCGQDRSR